MPQWLQTVLIVLAVLAALYLIAVLVQLVLAKILRRQAEPMRVSIEKAQREIADVSGKLEALAPIINGGPKEMPYGPLYDQARLLLKRGMANVNEVRSQLAAITAKDIPEQPWSAAFKLVPMSVEVVRRWQARRGVKTVSVHLTEVNDTLARIQQLQGDIATIPRREKEALLQLQKRAAEIAALIEGETRPRRPLTDERSVLREVSARLEQADKLLVSPEPSQSAVIVAYPLRTKAGEELQSLDKMVGVTIERRSEAEAALARSNARLDAFKSAIGEDEQAGFVRARFAAAADRLAERITMAQSLIREGEYESAVGGLAEVDKGITAQRDALAALNQERVRVAGLTDKASQKLSTVVGWINETPTRFERDVTGAVVPRLQELIAKLQALLPLEEIERMTSADEYDRQVEEAFTQADRANAAFVAARQRFEALSDKVNEASVRSLTSGAARVASELGQANRSYWGDLTPEAITSAADQLTDQWDAIRDQLEAIKESELSEVIERMEGLAATFGRVGDLHGQAVRALTQLDADKLQASTALNDDVMAKLLASVQQIAAESPSSAEQAARIHARVQELRVELQAPAPNYKDILASAEKLRKEAEAFVAGYRQQLQQVHGQLGLLKYRLEEVHSNLNRLRQDPRIDFVPLVEPVSERIQGWLAGFSAVATAPLDAARATLAAGEEVEREAAAQLSAAVAVGRAVNDRIGPTRMALAELNGTLSAAQAGLHDMADIGGERWGQPMLDSARALLAEALGRLERLEQPEQKFTPEGAQEAMAQIESLVKDTREKAATVHQDIARRVAEVRERRAQLTQALADGEAAAAANPALQDEWRLVRQQIAGLELRWKNATSYAEGLDAMTQAVQRAQRFVEAIAHHS
jgi:uncharacterized coiled-coil DUF342 family protein